METDSQLMTHSLLTKHQGNSFIEGRIYDIFMQHANEGDDDVCPDADCLNTTLLVLI